MAYNKDYYDKKKEKLTQKIQKHKDEYIESLVNGMNLFLNHQKELGSDYNELMAEEEASKKESEKPETKSKK